MINRDLQNAITNAFKYFSVVTIVGPRQSGKTTLCRNLYQDLPYCNMEDVAYSSYTHRLLRVRQAVLVGI